MNRRSTAIRALIAIASALAFLPCQNATAEQLQARAAVEREAIYLGEAFAFQIQISGSENPERPDLSGMTDFAVEYRGGQQNSSTSVTIVNGQMTQKVTKRYVYSYQLTPKRAGRLKIPSITIQADNRRTQTSPLSIGVQKPTESGSFKLRIELSKRHCYVGEPVTLTVTWYLDTDVRGFNMSLPLLEMKDRFHFIDPELDTRTRGKFYRIPISGGEVIGEKGQKRLEGKNYTTLSFQKILIPKKTGDTTVAPATVVCEVLSGYKRRRSLFGDDFFNNDFFGSSRQGIYRKLAAASNSLHLRVSEVPENGRPNDFSGHIGEYTIRASALPTEISVGDPITLKLTLSGPDYLDHVTLPPLGRQTDLKKDFKIPRERAVGEVVGKTKVFTQTIRPLRPGINRIPPIKLSYFDTNTGSYSTASTDPIPVTVQSTRVVTAMDAEGVAQPVLSTNEVETWTKGIAYNYEDMTVIEDQRFGVMSWLKSPTLFYMTVVPPFCYFAVLLVSTAITRLYTDPSASRRRKAYGKLKVGLRDARKAQSDEQCCNLILDLLRTYLGDKLGMPGGALTFNDVGKLLEERNLNPETLYRLKKLFDQCESGRYAGGTGTFDKSALIEESLSIAKLLEKTF